MKAHLREHHDEIWYIITDGLIKIMKVNTIVVTEGVPQMVEKQISE